MKHSKHAKKFEDWPYKSQHEFLAEDVWQSSAYGGNVVYGHGHHGNAILARFPIEQSQNMDVTQLRFERRGMLHCSIRLPGKGKVVHCVCVHLSLFASSRRRQLDALANYIELNSIAAFGSHLHSWVYGQTGQNALWSSMVENIRPCSTLRAFDVLTVKNGG